MPQLFTPTELGVVHGDASTQKRRHDPVVLSSGESELYACNGGGMEALGRVHIAKDLGENLEVNIKIDATATMVTLHRQGSGLTTSIPMRCGCRRSGEGDHVGQHPA